MKYVQECDDFTGVTIGVGEKDGACAKTGDAVSTIATTATASLRTRDPAKAPKCYHRASRVPGVPERTNLVAGHRRRARAHTRSTMITKAPGKHAEQSKKPAFLGFNSCNRGVKL